MEKQKKTDRLTIRLSPKDRERIEELAKFAHKSIPDFIVESCLNGNIISDIFIKEVELLGEKYELLKIKLDKHIKQTKSDTISEDDFNDEE